YPRGRMVDSATTIALGPGETIVFAAADGRTVRITGPYRGPAGGDGGAGEPVSESGVRRLVAQLLGLGPAEAGALAGVRGDREGPAADGADSRADPWLVHAERTTDQCWLPGRPVTLWRESAEADASGEGVDVDAGRPAAVSWSGRTAAWPAAIEPADGAVYLVRDDGSLRSAAIRMHALPAELEPNGLGAVAWLAARGCLDQARLLFRTGDG